MTQITVTAKERRIIPFLWLGEEDEITYDIVLAEPEASVEFWGLMLGDGEHQGQLHISVTHAAPQTTSQINVKAALHDYSRINVDGVVKIDPGAKGTDAWLAAHLLLLDDSASGRAVPSLEILENDVKAGHATTIGRIDDRQLFYLMSRGLPRKAARQLIIDGFLDEALAALPRALAQTARTKLADE